MSTQPTPPPNQIPPEPPKFTDEWCEWKKTYFATELEDFYAERGKKLNTPKIKGAPRAAEAPKLKPQAESAPQAELPKASIPSADTTPKPSLSPEEIRMHVVKGQVMALVLSTEKERVAMELPRSINRATADAAEILWKHLKTRADIFIADGIGQILMKDAKDQPIAVAHDDPYFVNLIYGYGLLSGTDAFNVIGKFIGNRCAMEGKKATMAFNSRYNATTKAVYFAESAGVLLRVTKDSITRVPNGTDGMLFKFSETTTPLQIDLGNLPKVKFSLIADDSSLLTLNLFDGLVFSGSAMTDEHKRSLVTTYVVLLVLAGVIGKERALLQVLGESGSGKTFFLKKIGRILVGDLFDVQPMPSDLKEFENVLVNNDFVVYDNVRNVKNDVRTLICQAVTGCQIERRELFTTMGRIKMPSKASLAMSAIDPILGESEQANRSITIKLNDRGATNREELSMLAELDSKRNELIAELLVRTQMVLQALNAESGWVPTTENRLAGVATFILRVAKHEGWLDDAENLLATWNSDQMDATLDEDDSLNPSIAMWITEPEWTPITLSAKELLGQLNVVALKYGFETLPNPRSLSVAMSRSLKAYQVRFGLKIGENKHTGGSTFEFAPSDALLAGLRASRAESDARYGEKTVL